MKENIRIIDINRALDAVFDFTVDSKQTARWNDAVKKEVAKDRPPKVGTLLISCPVENPSCWTYATLVEFKRNKTFHLKSGAYHRQYFYRRLDGNRATEFECREWMDDGSDIKNPIPDSALKKLKKVMEQPAAVRERKPLFHLENVQTISSAWTL